MRLEEFLRWESNVDDSHYAAELDARAERRLSAAIATLLERLPKIGGPLAEAAETLPAERLVAAGHWPELEYQLRASQTTDEPPQGLAEALIAALQANPQGGALLDFDGPAHRADAARRFDRFGAVPLDHRPRVHQRIQEAFDLLHAGSPAAARFTRRFTRVIAPIQTADADGEFGSFSSSWYPARTVLLNAHSRSMSLEELAAALLHEAIHSLVDVSEIGDRLIVDGRSGAGLVNSPWTGARISLQSLLDAYFVWYGLLRFWLQTRSRGAVERARADELIARCSEGFMPALSEVVRGRLVDVHAETRAAIDLVREAVSNLETAAAPAAVG